MKRALLVLVLIASPLFAADPVLKVPATVSGQPGAFITIPAETTCKELRWFTAEALLNVFPVQLLKDTKTGVVTSTVPGTYKVFVYGAQGDIPTDPVTCNVVVLGPVPPPIPPTPPVPPVPPPGPAPIAADGLHVMVVYETGDLSKLTPGQLAVVNSQESREWLDGKCVQDGAHKAWYFLDKDANVSALPKKWQDAMGRPRKGVPWLIASNPKGTSYEGPLPENFAETMAILSKAAGATGW